MEKPILIDTNIIIDAIRGLSITVDYLDSLDTLRISVVNAAEIIEGSSTKLDMKSNLDSLTDFEIIPISERISQMALDLVEKYYLKEGLNYVDALILSTAAIENLDFATLDKRHFKYIK